MKTINEKNIGAALIELNVPVGNKGFRYLVTAVSQVIEDESMLNNMTSANGIYDIVAKAHNTTISRAERAIRHSIECAYNLADKELFAKYTGKSNRKPTNRDFIAALAFELK